MTLRLWLLSLLSSAVVISSLHLWRHRPKPVPAPVATSEAEEIAALLPAPRPVPERRAVQRSVRKPMPTGMATVRGRVLGVPEAQQEAEEELIVVVSDEENEFEVTTEADGSFVVRLAPGIYRFHVELDEGEATLEAVTVGAEEDREVILRLTGGAAIKGTLRPPRDHGNEELIALIETRLSSESAWSESKEATMEDNQFIVAGLDAGQRYDLRLTVDGFRPVELTGLSAPSENLFVDLVRLARLRGGFGIARGETCPISEVTLMLDNDESQVVLMDHFCRFESGDLPPIQRVRVQVADNEWS